MNLGRVFKHEDRLIIDAEPHVMARIRILFTQGWNYGSQGLFTHKPISLPNTLSVCRDILWISERYPVDFIDNLYVQIVEKSKEYDRILADVYRQVRRYVEEGVTSVVILAPWNGINSFSVDGTRVIVVDTCLSAI